MFVSARYLAICARSLRWARRDVLMARHLRCRKWFYDPRMGVHHLDDSAPQPFWDNSVPPRLAIGPGDTVVIEGAWDNVSCPLSVSPSRRSRSDVMMAVMEQRPLVTWPSLVTAACGTGLGLRR